MTTIAVLIAGGIGLLFLILVVLGIIHDDDQQF